ncbi:2795_t:CDS:2, partial [Funneliformis geosporum]
TDFDRTVLFNKFENESNASLFLRKIFTSWDECEKFLNEWSKIQDFHIIKDHITHDESIICHRTFTCMHNHRYESYSIKDTATKKINCPFFVNVSCPKNKYPKCLAKKFTEEMIKNIKFMTIQCKFGITFQRKFLEGKFLSHPMYSKDLYIAIKKFSSNSKSLSNDAVQISNWLDQEKAKDSQWVMVQR